MDFERVQQIADAVLYEGYLLYPYTQTAVKNQQRWTFGGVYPEVYSAAQRGADACAMQTECLVSGGDEAVVTVRVRFLHIVDRAVGVRQSTSPAQADQHADAISPVRELRAGDQVYRAWQEAAERSVEAADLSLAALAAAPVRIPIQFSATREIEPVHDESGGEVGVLIYTHGAIDGSAAIGVERIGADVWKLSIRIENGTALAVDGVPSRDDALPHTMISTHAIIGVRGGNFISLLEPPEGAETLVAGCQNVGTWPVLVGEAGERGMMLSSPIILYDYPQIAPESNTNLFDGTEIDEILTLRIMTLTDDEKQEIRESDVRGRDLLARTEAIPPEQFMKMHGVIRTLRPLDGDAE
jgi:hypothetical protein